MFQIVQRALQTCFGLKGSVSRSTYLVWGTGLMLFKYVVEASAIGMTTGQLYTPRDFFNPLLSGRERFMSSAPAWLGMCLVLWSLPFVWIAVAMSIRRCRDAGLSPWTGMIMLVPLLNFAGMICLSVVPSEGVRQLQSDEDERALHSAWQSPDTDVTDVASIDPRPSAVVPAAAGIAAAVLYAITITVLTVTVFESYGAALFFGTPLVAGAVSAYMLNGTIAQSVARTLGHTSLVVVFCCTGFLLIGLEGAICIAMAVPIMLPIALMGALIGRAIAIETQRPRREQRGLIGCLVALPLLASLEGNLARTPTFAVTTQVDIQAPPDVVWESVVAFPEITARPAWYFRMGIASPLRSRIEGSGVGATRYCEFTTGTFVEPITTWDRPRRLAFDVTEQPEPMFELTPYRHIHPPHLDGSFRSTRGDFYLESLANQRTRLSGTTWYTLSIYPHAYWTIWSDALVHGIHRRVLEHIKINAEDRHAVQASRRVSVGLARTSRFAVNRE
jgi:uncharacterized membrane protein YhaH (DUF805 family)